MGVVSHHLKRFRENLDFACHFVAQVTDARYILEYRLLLVFQVFVDTLGVC